MIRNDICIVSVAVSNFNSGLQAEGIRGLRRAYRTTKHKDVKLLIEDLARTFKVTQEVLQ